MELRPYQIEAADQCLAKAQTQPTLLVLPTGTGKTVTVTEMLRRVVTTRPALFLVHRDELAQQAIAHFERAGFWCWLEKAESRPRVTDVAECATRRRSVVVASVPTLHKERLKRWPRGLFAGLFIDEAHHAIAPTWRTVVDHFECPVVGVTATPQRKGLAVRFQIGYQMTLCEAIEQGWLAPPRFHIVQHPDFDLSNLRIGKGRDVTDGELAAAFGEVALLAFFATLREHLESPSRRGLIFTPSVASAARSAEWLASSGVPAAFVDGTTPKDTRRDIVQRFREGIFRGLANCGVLTEGFDAPDCNAICLARPTRSEPLYMQMLGRGLRPDAAAIAGLETAEERRAAIAASDKPHCLVLDFQAVGADVDFVSPHVLMDGKLPKAKDAEVKLRETGEVIDFDALAIEAAALAKAEREADAYRNFEEARARQLAEQQPWTMIETDFMPKLKPQEITTDKQRALIYRLCKELDYSQVRCNDYWRTCQSWTRYQASQVIRYLQGKKLELRQERQNEQAPESPVR